MKCSITVGIILLIEQDEGDLLNLITQIPPRIFFPLLIEMMFPNYTVILEFIEDSFTEDPIFKFPFVT